MTCGSPWRVAVAVVIAGCGGSSARDGGADLAPARDGGEGLPEPCVKGSCREANEACDPLDGRCKLDGTTTKIGAPCKVSGQTPECGTMLGNWCNSEDEEGFPGGYCSSLPCGEKFPCPIGASCGRLAAFPAACYLSCKVDGDCRTPDYKCIDVGSLYVVGPSHRVCFLPFFPCFKDADCPSMKPTCKIGMGMKQGLCQ
ncbi:MAG: hypothetical protein EXR72_11600 [Myxococcales bacterium]|nr:hypothetical protein [Myxococcales bacterium]